MRKFVMLFIFAFTLVACGNSDEDLPVTQGNQVMDLQAENEHLKAELEAAQYTSMRGTWEQLQVLGMQHSE